LFGQHYVYAFIVVTEVMMRLNPVEFLLINNPIRPLLQQHLEVRKLLRLGGQLPGSRALEIGCGIGSGVALIYDRFGAAHVDAFDLDSRSLRVAHRRFGHRKRAPQFWVGNTRHIPVRDKRYDAVFSFGVLHHVRRWRDALTEIHRVLTPGGRFYCEEILKGFITHPVMARILHHPQHDRFGRSELAEALTRSDFYIIGSDTLFDLYVWFVAEKPNR
jgi:ubiquinone/menaquinone biosynthesis C-methylase UbiE